MFGVPVSVPPRPTEFFVSIANFPIYGNCTEGQPASAPPINHPFPICGLLEAGGDRTAMIAVERTITLS